MVQQDLDKDKVLLGEMKYNRLRALSVQQMNKLGTKEKTLKLGQLGEFGGKSQGKIL